MKYAAQPLVAEIEVFEKAGRIAAEIVPDLTYAKKTGVTAPEAAISALVDDINATDIPARAIDDVYFRYTPLEKTETGKLKRRKWIQ